MKNAIFLLALAIFCGWANPAVADDSAPIGQPTVFWHNGEWQTFVNGTWAPYNPRSEHVGDTSPPVAVPVRAPAGGSGQLDGIGQPPTGFGQTPGLGQPPTGLGQQSTGLGQQPSGLGQQPTGLGQQPTGLGQQPSGLGQQPSGLGRPNGQMGRTTIGIGPPSSFNNHLRPSSRVGNSSVGNRPPTASPNAGAGHGGKRNTEPADNRHP